MENPADRPKADLRKNLRVPLIIQRVHIHNKRLSFFGYSKNSSKSGMFIATSKAIAVGEQINLEFQLPAPLTGTVHCCCEVIWNRPLETHLPFEPGMGIRFIDMPVEISTQLDEWIKEQDKINLKVR